MPRTISTHRRRFTQRASGSPELHHRALGSRALGLRERGTVVEAILLGALGAACAWTFIGCAAPGPTPPETTAVYGPLPDAEPVVVLRSTVDEPGVEQVGSTSEKSQEPPEAPGPATGQSGQSPPSEDAGEPGAEGTGEKQTGQKAIDKADPKTETGQRTTEAAGTTTETAAGSKAPNQAEPSQAD